MNQPHQVNNYLFQPLHLVNISQKRRKSQTTSNKINDTTDLYFLQPTAVRKAESTSIESLLALHANVNNMYKQRVHASRHMFLNHSLFSRKGYMIYNVGNMRNFSQHITTLPIIGKIKGLIFLFCWLSWISNNWKLLVWYELTFVKEKQKTMQVLINIIYHNYTELLQIIRDQRTYKRISKL